MRPYWAKGQNANTIGCIGIMGLPWVFGPLAMALTGSLGIGLLGALLGVIFGVGAWIYFAKVAALPKTEEEKQAFEKQQALSTFVELKNQKRLHKNVDPTILQVMEAASYHYSRIETTLDNPFWSASTLPSHWQAVRRQMKESAELAMGEMLVLAAGCVGKPSAKREDDWGEVWEDLAELDFGDALEGLRGVMGRNWTDYAHKSPVAQHVFEPAKQIAERLKALADEADTMRVEAVAAGMEEKSVSVESIDLLLGEMRTLRTAETELDSEQEEHLQQGA